MVIQMKYHDDNSDDDQDQNQNHCIWVTRRWSEERIDPYETCNNDDDDDCNNKK